MSANIASSEAKGLWLLIVQMQSNVLPRNSKGDLVLVLAVTNVETLGLISIMSVFLLRSISLISVVKSN